MRVHCFALALVLLVNAVTAQRPDTLPPPRELSVLGITNGSIIALKTKYEPALSRGQGYLTVCNNCHPEIRSVATHHGTTKDTSQSQFRVTVYPYNEWGYPVISLENMDNHQYLAHTESSINQRRVDYGTFDPNGHMEFCQWAAVVVTSGQENYLALMNPIPSRHPQPQFVKLCHGCIITDNYILDFSYDSGANLQDYQLYTVEKV